ncbi:hypothetical protein SAMN04488518_11361 [Pseudovibrio ascidiaceicola]|uniref:GpW protein n=1 Tax=Pseudovibrio ascidiaceicola TaxID=285279 RepID=A0A1I4DXM2_9HYPH|nr:hypothetical protein [Pseudovibrio ascidiaceicola]SFK98408.1 hypothetical protein SAMN04488518_11361 [Pseudovibrio ascidiaceicola]
MNDQVKIGSDMVSINQPCAIATALRKIELVVASGGRRETVRFGRDEVTYSAANLPALQKLIAQYEAKCSLAAGGKVLRRARSVRWC